MISAEEFANEYGAYWRSALPMLESYVRVAALSTARVSLPLTPTSNPNRLSLISEAAFIQLRLDFDQRPLSDFRSNAFQVTDKAIKLAVNRISAIDRGRPEFVAGLLEHERTEANALASNLVKGLKSVGLNAPWFEPELPGCGFIDAAIGDVLIDTTLVEVKAVQRPFRPSDFRQLLTYAALNHLSHSYELDRLALVNPRLGVKFVESLDSLSVYVAGVPSSDLLGDICQFISSGEISR